MIDDGVLYRREILGQPFQQLVVPKGRRSHVLKVGHETYGGHMSVKKTKAAAGGANAPAYWAPASLIRPTPKKTPVA